MRDSRHFFPYDAYISIRQGVYYDAINKTPTMPLNLLSYPPPFVISFSFIFVVDWSSSCVTSPSSPAVRRPLSSFPVRDPSFPCTVCSEFLPPGANLNINIGSPLHF